MIVYILKCQNNKYYVGKTENFDRVFDHFNCRGSAWTQLHKPVDVLEIIENADSFDEDKYTKLYMSKYGIDNVRGAAYTQIVLDQLTKEHIEKEIYSTTDKCYRCGKIDHFINDCEEKINIEGQKLDDCIWLCEFCNKNFYTDIDVQNHEKICIQKKHKSKIISSIYYKNNYKNYNTFNTIYCSGPCYRCGRKGHYVADCFANTHIRGYKI